jgi:hypothetical protein
MVEKQERNSKVRNQSWMIGCLLLMMAMGFTPQIVFSASQPEKDFPLLKSTAISKQEIIDSVEDQVFEIPLVDLGLPANATLNGPYQEVVVTFNLPSDWELSQPTLLELKVNSEFYTFLEAFTKGTTGTDVAGASGSLEITFNGQKVKFIPVSQNGEFSFTIELPMSSISRSEVVQTLKISWDSVIACQYSIASILTIKPGSLLRFTYRSIPYSPEISRYPAPFYIDKNISPESTAIIIPPTPSEKELSALMSIASGFGKLSNGKLSYELFITDQIDPEIMDADHIVLVGKFDSLESTLLKLGVGNEIRDLLNTIDENSGFVFMAASPWNPNRAVLVATGKNDDAVVKASTALGVNGIMPFSGNQYAVIKDITTGISDNQYQIDQTLISLGSQDVISIGELGETLYTLPFVIPPDISINPEAYLEIFFRHSQLLDYLRSSITVSINEVLIGNIRLGDQSNENGASRFILPPNVIKQSSNVLSISANLVSQDICGDSRSGVYWAAIFGDSYLHLPPVIEPQRASQTYELSDFPNPFINGQNLRNTIFVLEQDDFYSLKKAFDMAYGFGNLAQSGFLIPSVIYAESFSPEVTAGNYLVIGLTGRIPFTAGINKMLPLPFSSIGKWEKFELPGVSFDLDQNQDLGYLELTQLTENDVNIITIMGNTNAGLDNAVKVLFSRKNADQLKTMNVAVATSDNQIYGFFFKVAPAENNSDEANTGISRQLLSPKNYPYYLIIIVLIAIFGLLLWPVIFHKKPD